MSYSPRGRKESDVTARLHGHRAVGCSLQGTTYLGCQEGIPVHMPLVPRPEGSQVGRAPGSECCHR